MEAEKGEERSGRLGRARGLAGALALLVAVSGGGCSSGSAAPATAPPARTLDVPYEPSAPDVVLIMTELAGVRPGDVVYDLGCGDGRIVIEAARRGARGVGVDLDPARIEEARAGARAAGVEDRVEFRVGDLFETDVSPATVVMLYLWPHVNLKLRPQLLAQLRPGARVVSHAHDMGDWPPDRTVRLPAGAKVHLWVVPERKDAVR